MKNVLEYLEASAERLPEKTAVIDDKEQCTYKELQNYSRMMGYILSEYSLEGKPAAVLMKKSVLTLEVFFGTVYAGGFYSLTDPDFPVTRLTEQLKVLKPEVVITLEEYKDKLLEASYKGHVVYAEELRENAGKLIEEADSSVDRKSEIDGRLAEIRDRAAEASPLYCNFTSGSTGTPKGVLVGHASVISFIDSFTEMFGITEEDVLGNQAPFDFDVSVKDIYSTIRKGATMVIIPTAFFRFPNGVMDMLEEHKVTTLIWAVSALVLLNRLHEFMYKVPPCINKVLFSGEEMPIKHLTDWMKVYPEAKFVNLYGPTEITCNCTYYELPEVPAPEDKIPSGYVFPGKVIYLMDEEGRIIPSDTENVTGEICVGGNELALGYYNNAEATGAAFIEIDIDGEKQKIYKTGDLGYRAGGLIYFAGRRDFQIKHNGHRIELEEVERALGSLPGIQQACCIYDHEKYRIIAFCAGTADKKAVVAGLKEKLPEYSLPNVYKFMEELPLTKNGKIDRKLLKESR